MMSLPLAALLRLLLIAGGASFVNPYANEEPDLTQVWLELPTSPVALGGDVHVRVHGASTPLRLRLARDDDDGRLLLAVMPLALDAEGRMTLPCGYFSRGGTYYVELLADNFVNDYDNNSVSDKVEINSVKDKRDVHNDNETVTKDFKKKVKREERRIVETEEDNETDIRDNKKRVKREEEGRILETEDGLVKSWSFDVLWPSAKLDVTPEQIQTYPERQVTAILEFPKVMCSPLRQSADFWLELLYCGHSSGGAVLCDGKNTSSHAHVLYSEQMHGFPGRRTMTLRCELFGQAGDYALTLRPAAAGPQDLATAFVKADWSEQFVLNVHGGSVFPCGEGVRVLFQYPECVLEGADRVRVFGRDPERLRYVAERRVKRGQHTVSFDCRLFSERYPEYCFVYVSQAVTGAVADVRMDCLPTLPLSDGGAGGWGAWSAWSACPSPAHCSTRTRSRHRFCDSPPPAYGAKYCEGQAVELAACECASKPWAGDSSMVVSEVGPQCRCGCVLHLAPSARLLAGSAKACPGRSFWLLQAEEGLVVRLRFEAVRLPCAGQALRARDGDSLGSPLLASWDGPDSSALVGDAETTTDSSGAIEIAGGGHILVELRSGDAKNQADQNCAGGFLAHASQIEPIRNASAAWASISVGPAWLGAGGGARAAALALAAAAALAALGLALHSARRTTPYQRAADKESLTDSDACSASLELGAATSGSRSTLLSEVVGGSVSLRRLLPSGKTRHTRLRDSDRASEKEQRLDEDEPTDTEEQDNASEGSGHSAASEATITPESAASAPAGQTSITSAMTHSPLKRSQTMADTPQVTSPPLPSTSETTTEDLSTSVTSVSERDSCSEKDKDSLLDRSASRASSSSAATLTNGWYSPALSGVSAARIRDNPKHNKESCNRRLLRSDLSLTSHPEMEIDYYDYEVNNAGSVPGSYLGMDPAFLVWIPPIEEGDIIKEIDENKIYEEILPKELRPDPGSNTESPEDRPSCSTLKRTEREKPDNKSIRSNESIKSSRKVHDRSNIIHPLNFSITDLQNSPRLPKRTRKKKDDVIQMKELTLTRSPVKVHRRDKSDNDNTLKRVHDTARETKDYDTLRTNTDLDDIKFADDTDSSNEIKFADDSPDSNKLVDKFNVKA
ncbi:uncharacterized protein LOC125229781 [Leguminivora glycinivorella]|uniref:uncharacterized protein LOC125229781 n=1 Tax=Leguminivora glycinivorella TaxID=1035111 RepID=UPI00200E0167|nr:uncharacterized protein LOC125229781 [Leguminivora glycinivorella]